MTEPTYHLLRLTVLFLAAGGVLILLKKAEPSWRVALIRGVFVGAVILFFASFTGVRWEIPFWEAMVVGGDASGESGDREIETVVVHTMDPAHSVAIAPPFERSGRVVLGLWIGGAVLLLIRLGITLGLEWRMVRGGRAAPAGVMSLWREVCAGFGVPAKEIRVVDRSVSPYLTLHGRLILPRVLLHESVAPGRLIHVFRHEAAHLRSRDHFWFPFISVLNAIFWFHPLVWWLAHRHLAACEEARDAEAARLGAKDSYRRAVAGIALGLLAPTIPAPALFRKSGRLVDRLSCLDRTAGQVPPVFAATGFLQVMVFLIACIFGTASPSLRASSEAADLFGLWLPVDNQNRFARQLEVYEWGGEVKMRVWESVGDRVDTEATISSFRMNRDEFVKHLSENDSVSILRRSGSIESAYSLSRRGDRLEVRIEVRFDDGTRRRDQDFTFEFARILR
jgi:beta-lactamase regulating signal transducer with metallopeptidase domain